MSENETGKKPELYTPPTKQPSGQDLYNWALYELSRARNVEKASGIDTSDLRQQIVFMLQKDLYEFRGDDDLTI
jgi:hypothetical protein